MDVLAVASWGGHFEQLRKLRAAWTDASCVLVTTSLLRDASDGDYPIAVVKDCHGWQVFPALVCLFQAIRLVARYRPRCVVSTGALPGLLMAVAGRIAGSRVIWIDSLANAERMSTSGRVALFVADECLTQWPLVAKRQGATYSGSLF